MCKEVFHMYNDIIKQDNKESEVFVRIDKRLVCDINYFFKERQGDIYFPTIRSEFLLPFHLSMLSVRGFLKKTTYQDLPAHSIS